jgi:hypothetical protein
LRQDSIRKTISVPLPTKRKWTAYIKLSTKKLGKGTNTVPGDNPNNHGKVQSKLFFFDNLTISMITSKKQVEIEKKINEIVYSKSKPINLKKSV